MPLFKQMSKIDNKQSQFLRVISIKVPLFKQMSKIDNKQSQFLPLTVCFCQVLGDDSPRRSGKTSARQHHLQIERMIHLKVQANKCKSNSRNTQRDQFKISHDSTGEPRKKRLHCTTRLFNSPSHFFSFLLSLTQSALNIWCT